MKDDPALLLFPAAPVEEPAVLVIFVSAQRDPKVKHVAEEDEPDVAGQTRNAVEHPEEFIFRFAAGQMCVGDHQPAFGHSGGGPFPCFVFSPAEPE